MEIGEEAFVECGLRELSLPKGLSKIGRYAFSGCEVESFHFPKGEKIIEEGVFSECTKLKEVEISDEVEEISFHDFSGCRELKELRLPAKLRKIAAFAFDKSLKKLSVSRENENFLIKNGGLYSKDGKILFLQVEDGEDRDFILPSEVKEVKSAAFAYRSFKSITLNENILSLPEFVFYATKAREILGLDSVEKIEKEAFAACHIEHLVLPKKVKSLPPRIFEQASIGLLTLPRGLEEIGEDGFSLSSIGRIIFTK